MSGLRARRTLAVAFATLASVSWGASASAAPAPHHAQANHPILIVHKMSSCGAMNAL